MADGHVGTKPPDESAVAASVMRQRKRRKWDEPADFFISPGISVAGAITMGFGSTIGISTPGVLPLSNAIAASTIVPSITPSATSLVQKLCQSKAQDELIAREIVINDAEPTIRYKLTKRQTQEEIQRSSGAVVITRGKYRPTNALPDSEKPLYLHISAGSHLKDMAERITAVDRAASMVEEIIRQGHNLPSTSSPCTAFSSAVQANQPLSTCLFLGFEPDPSQNIAARIRGPNDQYINHIINETGAIVMLKGLGSGNLAISHGEEGMVSHYEDDQQPLHLYLSSTNSKSLEAARNLAENLLDTISAECGASRVSSKVYGAVPPPQQLLLGVTSSTNMGVSDNPVGSSSCGVAGTMQTAQSLVSSTLVGSSVSTIRTQNGNLAKCGTFLPNSKSYALPISTGGTCYSGYGGIYPQATPLQQVALALKQAPVSTISAVSSTTSQASTLAKMTPNLNADTKKRPPHKRKFQELPVVLKELPTLSKSSRQGSECFNKPGLEDADAGKFSFMPPPKKLNHPAFGKMPMPPAPPPPPYSINIPPPPPKFPSTSDNNNLRERMPPSKSPLSLAADAQTTDAAAVRSSWVTEKAATEPISGALLKLVEYEEEEEDMVASAEESCRSNVMRSSSSKPFWAV